ncbi:peptide chain release factor N(5)-glutamine methyltransferase [Latilactobacillus graminis]|uniref:Release factor glutamine methyltransferase n=2 Tax=Latilactobacillus graminis TaxID=60519 RepID=A0AA89I0V9_9LACO|nr:peptide chain release factor N(5)-glutamine methyltransferase [Latilactobacillus graminis]KRM22375.1 protein-(glutamine-N5) methyltransferase, release factor-specific [Latilactobacillus graminis DSM 20719]QFP79451.1 peptide chain release factor N(5)-glutamine methyltransferase [Latilactobacillus graminis]
MAQLTYLKALNWAFLFLEEHAKEREAARFLLLGRRHWTTTQLVLHYHDVMPSTEYAQYQADLNAFVADQPVQYILGYATFYGRDFKVTPATLIPRLETEELVEWVLETPHPKKQPLSVLDVGTGTGAIAITLACEHPEWSVTAIDISPAAIQVAQENARQLAANVNFIVGDFLTPVVGQKFDIIVSNPPYIAQAERNVMDESVLKYEPDLALFAAHNGLVFYERFAKEVRANLNQDGQLYLEFGYQQKAALVNLFERESADVAVVIRKDMANWARMAKISYATNKIQ